MVCLKEFSFTTTMMSFLRVTFYPWRLIFYSLNSKCTELTLVYIHMQVDMQIRYTVNKIFRHELKLNLQPPKNKNKPNDKLNQILPNTNSDIILFKVFFFVSTPATYCLLLVVFSCIKIKANLKNLFSNGFFVLMKNV